MAITNSETIEETLPYGTSWENILKLLEAIKKKQGDEKSIRAVYSGAKIDGARKTMEILGLIDGFNFKALGKELAYETNEEKKREIFRKVILNYPPYELFLAKLTESEFQQETDIENVKNFWGRNDFGASPNNRDEAASVFGSFIELAGLGEFIIGRRGKATRIKWNAEAKKLIDEAHTTTNLEAIEETTLKQEVPVDQSSSHDNGSKDNVTDFFPTQKSEPSPPNIHSVEVTPNITITVDMSEWDTDKIKAFFKAAYGEFDND
ncbi:hypothetical protein NST83_04165 [Paenibacillus sp. FSL R10-2782]|uniref:hypothetical protein n=1 Tax=Paenibacillus sp. FSL R10-2782 TaxID=2954661 RepID=UPI0031596357